MNKKTKKLLSVVLAVALIMTGIPQTASAKEVKLKNTAGNTKTMAVGSTFQLQTNLSASSLKFSSSKKAVATVSAKGLITAKKKGKATITVASGKKKLNLKVTVKNPVGYTISKKAGTYTGSVKTKVTAKKGYTVYYTTSNKFAKANAIKAKSSKTFTFTSTKTLKLYPVKGKTMTTASLNKTEKNSELRSDYLYTIKKSEEDTGVTEAPTGPSVTASADPAPDTSATTAPPVISADNTEEKANFEKEYVKPDEVVFDEADQDTEVPQGAVTIMLNAQPPEAKYTSPDGDYEISKKNKLTINAKGTYLIQTETTEEAVDGLIEVNTKEDPGTVHIILDGVNLTSSNNTAPDEDTGLITIKKNTPRAIITVKDGTENTLLDVGETGVEVDDDDNLTDVVTYTGGILCKKNPLTINGSGTLNIYTKNGNGIKATDSLKILGTTINVSGDKDGSATGRNGITGKTELSVSGANLTIHATGDALKTTLDKDDLAENPDLADQGNMDLDGGNYNITSDQGDGISSARTLRLNPAQMTVNAKNAAPGEEDSCKGVKANTTIYIPETAKSITVDSIADDAMHCDGSILVEGGDLTLTAGDDAIRFEALQINGGSLIAASAAGMKKLPAGSSDQPIVNIRFETQQAAGTYVVLKDKDNQDAISAHPARAFQSIMLSGEKLKLGETYKIHTGASTGSLNEYKEFLFDSFSVIVGDTENSDDTTA